jgi:hypothetical protein
MSACSKCGLILSHPKSIYRHLKKYCKGETTEVDSEMTTDVEITTETTTTKKIIKLKNVGLKQANEIAQMSVDAQSSNLNSNDTIHAELSNLRAEVAELRKLKETPSVIVNQTINNTVNIFDKRCINLFEHLLKQCDNDLKRTASKIYSLFRGKKTRKTKYDYQDLEKILPPEVFSKILKRTGKDINGNYKYEYVGSDGVETCSTEHVDKILEDIMTDSGLQCYSQAIKESNDAYSRDEEMDNVRGEGGATNYLMEYSLMSKIQDYRKLVCDPKHLDNTVARITNSD